MTARAKNKIIEPGSFLDDMLETSQAAAWLKINPKQLLNDSKGRSAKIPGFWLSERLVRFHRRSIIAKFAHDSGLPPQVIAAMFSSHESNFFNPNQNATQKQQR